LKGVGSPHTAPSTARSWRLTCSLKSVARERNEIRATQRTRDAQKQAHGRADHRVPRQADAGVNVADLFRLEGLSMPMFYKWRVKCGGMEASDAKPPRELEAENARLKTLLAEAALDYEALKVASG